MESKVRYGYDASLVIKATQSVAITATETGAKVALDVITGSPYGVLNGRISEREINVVLQVEALDHTTGDETYAAAFTSWDVNGANPVTHATRNLTTADIGKALDFAFKTDELLQENSAARSFGIVMTLAGTTPILQYAAWIAPNPDRV